MRKDTYNKLKQISDYLYHASPKDLDILSGDAAVSGEAIKDIMSKLKQIYK